MAAATMHSACCHCQSFIGAVSGVVSDSCVIFGRVLSGRKHKKTLNLILFIQALHRLQPCPIQPASFGLQIQTVGGLGCFEL